MTASRFAAGLLFAGTLLGQTGTGVNSATTTTQQQPPPPDPEILEDGGFSIGAFYWFSQPQPYLFSGSTATAFGDLGYFGKSKRPEGAEVNIPAGRADTLRISYFRVQGDTNETLGVPETIFSEAFSAGDYMASTYRIQNVKVSWDYLSYTFQNRIRFKTLYEAQWTTVSTDVSAPFVAATTDSSGNVNNNSAHGSKNLFYPTFGVKFEQPVTKSFRWEAKTDAFGLPHHSDIWEAQVDAALRIRSLELFAGGKLYHLKTGPQTDQYFADTLQGAFVGVRYYWRGEQ